MFASDGSTNMAVWIKICFFLSGSEILPGKAQINSDLNQAETGDCSAWEAPPTMQAHLLLLATLSRFALGSLNLGWVVIIPLITCFLFSLLIQIVRYFLFLHSKPNDVIFPFPPPFKCCPPSPINTSNWITRTIWMQADLGWNPHFPAGYLSLWS